MGREGFCSFLVDFKEKSFVGESKGETLIQFVPISKNARFVFLYAH